MAGPRRVRARRGRSIRRGPRAPGRSATTRWVVAWLASVAVAVLLQLGPCGRSVATRAPGPALGGTLVDGHAHAPASARAGSRDRAVDARLVRGPGPHGHSQLRGETTFRWASDAATRVTEEVQLDPAGRLLRAEIELHATGDGALREPLEHISIDASQGIVQVVTRAGVTERHDVATELAKRLPWAYVPVEAPGGVPASTPTAAIVAEQAAREHDAVWLIDARGHGAAVMSDQILVQAGPDRGAATEGERWLVLGDDVATFGTDGAGKSELLRVRVAALGTEMTPDVTGGDAP